MLEFKTLSDSQALDMLYQHLKQKQQHAKGRIKYAHEAMAIYNPTSQPYKIHKGILEKYETQLEFISASLDEVECLLGLKG